MSKREGFTTITAMEKELEIASHWISMCEASGLYDPAMNPENIFRLAGAIMHDPVVKQRHLALMIAWRPPENGFACAPSFVYFDQVLRGMTPEEKRQLKARIVAAHPAKVRR